MRVHVRGRCPIRAPTGPCAHLQYCVTPPHRSDGPFLSSRALRVPGGGAVPWPPSPPPWRVPGSHILDTKQPFTGLMNEIKQIYNKKKNLGDWIHERCPNGMPYVDHRAQVRFNDILRVFKLMVVLTGDCKRKKEQWKERTALLLQCMAHCVRDSELVTEGILCVCMCVCAHTYGGGKSRFTFS